MNEQSTMPATRSKRAIDVRPVGPLGWLREEIDRVFDDFPLARSTRSAFNFPGVLAATAPALELVEKGDGYLMTIEVPGIDAKDVAVELAESVLTVSGEKREESETSDKDCLIQERRYGAFRRQLSLPADVDPESLKATMHNGVLKLEMKKDKKAERQSRKIPVT